MTIDLTQYIQILFVFKFIFESLFVPDIVPIDIVGFFGRKKICPSYSKKKLFHFAVCQKKKSANTNKKNCVQKYIFNKNRSEQSSRDVFRR